MFSSGIGVGVAAVLMMAVAVRGEAGGEKAGIVSNVKVTSDKVADVSSVEDWAKSYIKPGMTDKEKAIAGVEERGGASTSEFAPDGVSAQPRKRDARSLKDV